VVIKTFNFCADPGDPLAITVTQHSMFWMTVLGSPRSTNEGSAMLSKLYTYNLDGGSVPEGRTVYVDGAFPTTLETETHPEPAAFCGYVVNVLI
jgi:hypothetical protein